jgi:F0F1-type ATP synthase membrane subunit a
MVPYVYPVSVEMGLIISIRFPVWLGLVVSSVGFNYKAFIAGFCPMGVHWLGAPFFIVVEVVSLLLRPVTLTMRFLVSILIGQIAFFVGGRYLVTLVWFKVGFIVGRVFYAIGVFAEVALMLLQCYVFVMLLIHYADEHIG